MKYLQSFSLFESRTPGTLSKRQEAFLNRYTRGTWSVNPATGLVDVQGTFDCSERRLKSLLGIRFGKVTEDFYCDVNKLTTLEGAPQTVTGGFRCHNNQLTSLEGAPQTVEGNFYCSNNQLTTLEGAPRKVAGNFWCYRNKLTTLEGAPLTVRGDFWCYSNKLTTLVGAPQTVGGDFLCYNNQLTSLAGAPQTVTMRFYCHHNELTTLEGAPQTVTVRFYCDDFELGSGQWNLEGWLKVLHTGSPEAQKLILTIIGADYWNSEISRNPVGTLLRLAAVWDNLPKGIQRGIKIPSNLQNEFHNFLDLERAGVF